jgi:hypothetical protein
MSVTWQPLDASWQAKTDTKLAKVWYENRGWSFEVCLYQHKSDGTIIRGMTTDKGRAIDRATAMLACENAFGA